MSYVSTTSSPAIQLYYEDHGSGQPVVLIHGWPLSHRMWEGQVTALVDAGFRTIAYDRRGFGESERPSSGYDYDTFASDLNDLLTTLDLRDVILAGFSMGGGEVARYLGTYGSDRIAKAMFIGAVPPFLLKTADNPEGADQAVFDGMMAGVRKDRIAFLDGFFHPFFNYTGQKDFPVDAIAHAKWVAYAASPVATVECIRAFGTTDFRADLKKITIPTLVLHGTADQIVPFDGSGKRTAEMIPGSTLVTIEGGAHGLPVTHPDELTKAMVDFAKS
ncbi:MAG TPA: alpha/beta hydrolase [Gemmatimonadaceae bacterium]|nr:alpha/beta hydrolase [Gemmatimonadaceae bacterium]